MQVEHDELARIIINGQETNGAHQQIQFELDLGQQRNML
jgi:hypothetical protein